MGEMARHGDSGRLKFPFERFGPSCYCSRLITLAAYSIAFFASLFIGHLGPENRLD